MIEDVWIRICKSLTTTSHLLNKNHDFANELKNGKFLTCIFNLFSILGRVWGWGRGAKSGTITPRGLCHFGLKKWSNFPSTEKISFVFLNITIVQLIKTHINLGGAPWNGTFGFFEQCAMQGVQCYLLTLTNQLPFIGIFSYFFWEKC